MALAEASSNVIALPWEGKHGFDAQWKWRQGEHVTLVGPTGGGKTSLELAILPRREYVLFLSTKRVDSTQDALKKQGYKVIRSAKELHPDIASRVILRPPWPDVPAKELMAIHAEVFQEALMQVFREGHWTVVCDEARYLTKDLGLATEAQLLWLQGRSLNATVVAGTQRPRWIPLEAYDQATHLFFWRDPDVENVQRIAQMAGLNQREVMDVVLRLRKNEILYSNRDTGDLVVTSGYQPYLKSYRY